MFSFTQTLRKTLKRFMPSLGTDSGDHDIYTQGQKKLSKEKREELNLLCEQLLKRKELIASGKLQLLGLAKIKKRLGKNWVGLSKVVYSTVEEVINSHLEDSSDFFLRYKDENYLIFFTKITLEDSKIKSALIAKDIQQRLFQLNEKHLRELEIRQHVSALKKNANNPFDFDDFLETFTDDEKAGLFGITSPDDEYSDNSPPAVLCIEVESEDCVVKDEIKLREVKLPKVNYGYLPMWDVSRNALNTYICLATPASSNEALFDAHIALYTGFNEIEQAAMDIQILRKVLAEVRDACTRKKKILIACPVQHSTLYNYNLFDQYRGLLHEIPAEHRPFIVFYVMDVHQTLPVKDAYWFVLSLKPYCRFVFAEVPLRQDINFNYLKRRHVDAAGFRLSDIVYKKLSTEKMMNLFHSRAVAMKIQHTFVFGISQVDDVSSTALSKYDYVSGDVIHAAVAKPDGAHKFSTDDLLLKLASAAAQP